jgi:glutaredoxin 3
VSHIEEVRIDLSDQERDRMMALTGKRTVPQIFIGDLHVGGCDDLMALDNQGGLVPLLQAS